MNKKIIAISCITACVCLGCVLTSGFINNNTFVKADNVESEVNIETASVANEEINIDMNTENTESQSVGTVVESQRKIDKDYVLNHMLNSIDYFDTAEGELVTNLFETNQETTASFSVNISDDKSENFAYEKCTSNEISIETLYVDGIINSYNNMTKSYSASSSGISTDFFIAASERITVDEEGINTYYYRDNKMYSKCASQCLMSQELTFGFLADQSLWEIAGEADYLGYDCIVVEGKTNPEYGKKLGVDSFKFYVEKNTGILMNFEGLNESGDIIKYSTVKNITIDEQTTLSKNQLQNKFNSDEYAAY